jgi:hypothetical protein
MAGHSPGIESPRMLRVTFDIWIPEGLRKNVQFKRVQEAVDHITTAVQAAVTTRFPWADRIEARAEWSYAWWQSDVKEITLPDTGVNQPAQQA